MQGIVERSIKNVDGIILVFAINDAYSFDFAKAKYDFIKEKKIPFILVGNKVDLNAQRGNGGVSYEAAKNQASIWKVTYLETSATTLPVIVI